MVEYRSLGGLQTKIRLLMLLWANCILEQSLAAGRVESEMSGSLGMAEETGI